MKLFNKTKKILVVRFRGVGDVIMTLPALQFMKEQKPHYEINYLTSNEIARSGLFNGIYFIENVIGCDYNHSLDTNICLPSGDYSKYDKIYNLINKVDFCKESVTIPRIELFAKLLGVKGNLNNTPICMSATEENLVISKFLLTNSNYSINKQTVLCQIDSRGLSRRWNYWQGLVSMLLKEFNVIISSDKFTKFGIKDVINLTGQTDLHEYFSLISCSDIIVSCDSSALHIAGVLNKKALGLFGSVDPILRIDHYESVRAIIGKACCVPCNDWQQYSCNGKLPCMNSIYPKEVYVIIEKMLKGVHVDKYTQTS